MCCVARYVRQLLPETVKSAALQSVETASGGFPKLPFLGRPAKPAQFHSGNHHHSLVCGKSARHSAGRPAHASVAPKPVPRRDYAVGDEWCCDIQTERLRSAIAASCVKARPRYCCVE